jgi:glycosyltransferase involved in cell wall biosynthesis
VLASPFRSFDAYGNAARQARLHRIGAWVAKHVAATFTRGNRPDLWFTYHLHHKAPDHVGPAVSRSLDIPYVVAEASTAPRQREGAWAFGHAHALAAIRGADMVVFVNPADVAEVQRVRPSGAPATMLAPFIDVARFAGDIPSARPVPAPRTPLRFVTVAMMREGAKLASYRVLADALARVADLPFALTIVGDGPARSDVASAFAPLRGRVTLAGARSKEDVAALLWQSDLFVWPAVDEAIGIAFLEAQACALAVVGADTPGVAAVVAEGRTGLLAAPGDAASFANAVRRLVLDGALRERMRAAAPAYVRERHDLPAAAKRLDAILRDAVARHRALRAELPC